MKVICINEEFTDSPQDTILKDLALPICGNEYDVIDVKYCKEKAYKTQDRIIREMEGVYYRLSGFKHMFHASNFATLPEQSADEMQSLEKEGIVNIETPVI